MLNECYYKRRSSYAPAITIVVRLLIQLTVNWDVYRIFKYSFIEKTFDSFTSKIFVLALVIVNKPMQANVNQQLHNIQTSLFFGAATS